MLTGKWASIQELEESINLDELQGLLSASRKAEERSMRFHAALKGINLDDDGSQETVADRVEAVKRRAEARLQGMNDDDIEKKEMLDEFGLRIETE